MTKILADKSKPVEPIIIGISVLVIIFSISISSCKKNESDLVQSTNDTIFYPLSVSGHIILPDNSAISPRSLTVNAGVFDKTIPNDDGSFLIKVNKDATQLLWAKNQNGNPVLMNIVIGNQKTGSLELSTITTAKSLIFLNPVAVIPDPTVAETILSLIEEMNETKTLGNLIGQKIAADPDILSKSDIEIANALMEAVNKFVEEIGNVSKGANYQANTSLQQFIAVKHLREKGSGIGTPKNLRIGDLFIIADGPQSGVEVSAAQIDQNNYSISVSNSKKRYIDAFLDDSDNGNNIGFVSVESRKNLLSLTPLSPISRNLNKNLNVATNPSSVLYVYGLGAQDILSLESAPDWQNRVFKPVIRTAVFDFLTPLIQVITGIRRFNLAGNFTNPGGIYGEIIDKLLGNQLFILEIRDKIISNDYSGAIVSTLLKCINIFAENPIFLTRWLSEQGFSLLATSLETNILFIRLFFIVPNVFELGSAVYGFVTSSWLVSFSLIKPTGTIPILVSAPVKDITRSTAVSGGNIVYDGSVSITARGVCWSTSTNPTVLYAHSEDGSGLGEFTSNLTGLNSNSTYYVRAYATNNTGTGYGNQISFTTLNIPSNEIIFNPNLIYGTLSDVDGNIYKTIQIGTQTWMAENLKTTKYNDYSNIHSVSLLIEWSALSTPGYCWYGNDSLRHKPAYGALYNWYSIDATTNGGKNVCPTNWHVPSDAELTILTTYLGGESVAGPKLKESGTIHWKGLNDATNESGFTALPGGNRMSSGVFGGPMGLYGYWWSTSEYDASSAWLRYMSFAFGNVTSSSDKKLYGFSVRCLKDN